MYGGLRYAEANIKVGTTDQAIQTKERWTSPAVGVIARTPIKDPFSMLIKLDGAGFGLTRDSYWNAIAVIDWELSQHWSVAAGYRAARFDAEPDGGNELELEIESHGPMLGISYQF